MNVRIFGALAKIKTVCQNNGNNLPRKELMGPEMRIHWHGML